MHFLGKVVLAQAYVGGFRDSFLVCAAITAVALIPAWIMGMQRRRPA
jgi:hypothetical protein